jgi:hypothetical protein
MVRRVALVRVDVSEERVASVFREEKSKLRLLGNGERFSSLRFLYREDSAPTRRPLEDPHDATSQKTAFFMNIAV